MEVMEYNTERANLNVSEYGRHIYKMIQQAISETNRDKRNKMAYAIVAVMSQLNPQLRDSPDFAHKLWDHLIILSDFKLDIDSPYPMPTPESFNAKPDPIKYPESNIRYMHYGRNLENIISSTSELEKDKDENLRALANLMKRFYLNWNRDTVTDDVILRQLAELSKGKLNTRDIELNSTQDILLKNQNNKSGGFKKKNKKKFQKKKY
jgi:hypothetical protein